MLVAETGYGEGGEPKVSRIGPDGARKVLASGAAFGDEVPVTSVAAHDGVVYVVYAGTVSRIEPDGSLTAIISGLPGGGDHQANQLAFKDDQLYLAIGTVTNSGVVGEDSAVFGWLKDPHQASSVRAEILRAAPLDTTKPAGSSDWALAMASLGE